MTLPSFALSAIIGIAPLLWLPELPSLTLIAFAIVLSAVVCFHLPVLQPAGIITLFFCWGALAAWQEIHPTITLPGKALRAEVVITATDGAERHFARILSINGQRQFPPPGIAFYGQTLPAKPCAGQRWQMLLKARAVHGQLNDGLFDRQRYALSAHLPLTGRFVSAELIESRCALRARFIGRLESSIASYPWRAVMLALAAGERRTVTAEVNTLLQETGTAHLMAISGLHISLLGMLGWGLVRGAQALFPTRYIDWRLPIAGSFVAMLAYAWLSGFQPPAQRTVIAAGCWTMLRLSGRRWTSWEVWLCCVAAILILDPMAALAESLWLSAFAVAALIFLYQWMPLGLLPGGRWVRSSVGLLHLQVGLLFLLLPLQITLFHAFSWTSLLANLIAVPLVTLVEIPLLLLGMALNLSGPVFLEQGAWYLADRVLAVLFWFLNVLPDGWIPVDRRWQGAMLLPWLAIILWRLRAFRHWAACTLAVSVMLFYPAWRRASPEGWSVTMLDVGQGLAMVIARHDKAILYDTGPAWDGGDSGKQIIIPWLRWQGLQPEGVILSHEHLDHRGGLESLRQRWPELWIRSPLGWKGHQPCFRGHNWQWEGLHFRAVWPLPGSTLIGNNRSCVVRVDDGKHSILLTGDIEIAGEKRMLSRYWQHLTSTLIQVPHHGSSTSSSVMLLSRVGGQAALASASRYNAWRLPSAKVQERYQQRGYAWYDTPHQGQITVKFTAEGWQILSLRDDLFRRWYHQRFGDTRQNG